MNPIQQQDIAAFSLPEDLKKPLANSTIVVTGATGLIGSTFVRCIDSLKIGVKFILPVRNVEKARDMFADIISPTVQISPAGLDFFNSYTDGCDYIVHCASPTNGAYMSAHPVETFNATVDSTRSALDFCRQTPVKGMVYLSSIEYYGQIFNDDPVTEDMMGHIDHYSPRNSYALGKQAAEYLVFAYADEFGVPAKTARLTQTFGAGIDKDDSRVFAQFARSVVEGRDIVLHTEGRSAKPYCYLTDCVSAIVYILIKGRNGEAYNVATPGSYVSIRQLAEMFCSCSDTLISITCDTSSSHGYAAETTVNLDPSKLLALGWQPRYTLPEMLSRLIASLK